MHELYIWQLLKEETKSNCCFKYEQWHCGTERDDINTKIENLIWCVLVYWIHKNCLKNCKIIFFISLVVFEAYIFKWFSYSVCKKYQHLKISAEIRIKVCIKRLETILSGLLEYRIKNCLLWKIGIYYLLQALEWVYIFEYSFQ